MNTRFLNLEDGSQASVFSEEDFKDLIEEKLGYESKAYLEEMLEETSKNEQKDEEIENLKDEICDLKYEIKFLNGKIEKEREELLKDVEIDDKLSTSLCRVIKEVKKIGSMSKSKAILEQQNVIVNMLSAIAKI